MARIGSYDVVKLLSSGGMSDAILARSPAGRLVVLKRPRTHDAELAARLRDEARLGAKLFHPHLVETLDSFDDAGLPVLALGYVEGPTVDQLRRHGPVAPAAVARLGCHVAEALGAIHGALGDDGAPLRAVHRDVSARNIIVTARGDAVLIDLGIARFDELRAAQTATGMVLGTLRYMAPELIDGAIASPAADFYSLGCVLIEAATGGPAFEGQPSEVAGAIVTRGPLAAPRTKTLDPRLLAALQRMVARDPAQRFQHAHEVSAALRKVEADLGGGGPELARRAADAQARPPAETSSPGMPAAALPPPPPTLAPKYDVTEQWTPPPPSNAPVAAPFGIGASAPAPDVTTRLPLELAVPPRPTVSMAPLELAHEPRRRAAVDAGPANPRDWYPTTKKDYRWIAEGAKKVIAFVVVVGGGAAAWYWHTSSEAERERLARDAKAKLDAELLQKALGETPPCEFGSGAMWVYEDKKGTSVVVETLERVPPEFRKRARCVVPSR